MEILEDDLERANQVGISFYHKENNFLAMKVTVTCYVRKVFPLL